MWRNLGSNKTSRIATLVSVPGNYLLSMSGKSEIVPGTKPAGKSQTEKSARGNKDSGKDLFCKMRMSAVEARVTHTLLFI